MYSGQSVSCGKKATLSKGKFLSLRSIHQGVVVCNAEQRVEDGGYFARASGDHVIVISHNPDNNTTRRWCLVSVKPVSDRLLVVKELRNLCGRLGMHITSSRLRGTVGQESGCCNESC